MTQHISCFCGASQGEMFRTHIRGGKHQPIAHCTDCGTVQKVLDDEEEHEEFHEQGEQAAELDLDSLSESYVERNLADVRRRVSHLQPVLDGDERLLDFGTGMGHFLEAISPHVEEAIGSEINQKRLSFVREKLGFDVYEGTPPLKEAFPEGAFDVVTMYHTLEHLPNPVRQLEQVRHLLAPDGMLVVEVPNHDDWLLRWSGAYADFYYQEAHAYYFTPRTLQNALHQAGFAAQIEGVQRYSYQNALHWLFAGAPQLEAPSRHRDEWRAPVDKLYGAVLRAQMGTDTIIGVGHIA